MPTQLDPGFYDYLNKLAIKPNSRNNYRQYVRWIERYGSGGVDLSTMQTEGDVEHFVDIVAKGYNDDHLTGHRFNKRRRSDTKCVIGHYMKFLRSGCIEETQDTLEEDGAFDTSSAAEGKEKVLRSIALRRGQRTFREELLIAYDRSCAATGTSVEDVLEAAHIMPYNGVSTNHISNGLLLRSDIHALFDLSLVSINPQTLTIFCSEQIRQDGTYEALHGKHIRMPAKANQHPSRDALRMHFEKRAC